VGHVARALSPALVALAVASCAPRASVAQPATSPPPVAAAQRDTVLYRHSRSAAGNLLHRLHSSLHERTEAVVRDSASWARVWTTLTSAGRPLAAPDVDFAREMVLVAGMGLQPHQGDWITIDSVRQAGDTVRAHVTTFSFGENCLMAASVSAPVHVVRVARSDLPVRFEAGTVVVDRRCLTPIYPTPPKLRPDY
jgi:hypothetical protein